MNKGSDESKEVILISGETEPTLSKNEALSTQKTLSLIGLAGLTTVLLAIIPLMGWINYPFRLLITIVHELGHGLTALFTGGEFIRFVVFTDGSGLAYTTSGWRFLIIPAGYLGVALFGALLIMLGRSPRWSRIAMGVIGVAMMLLSLRYGVPSIFTAQFAGGLLTTISGLIFGTIFLAVAIKATPSWIIFLLHVVVIKAGLTAFSDIFMVIGLSTHILGETASDAHSMAELTYIPAIIWALIWALMAVVIIGGAIWITWIAPLRGKSP